MTPGGSRTLKGFILGDPVVQGEGSRGNGKTSVGEKLLEGRGCVAGQELKLNRWISTVATLTLTVVALTTRYIRVFCTVCGCVLRVHARWQPVCHCLSNAVVCVCLLCLAAFGNPSL